MSNSGLNLSVLLFGRLLGFFVISPLFTGKAISKTIRIALSLACSLLLFPSIAGNIPLSFDNPFLLSLLFIKEIVLGYLIGFIFSLLFEGAAFAGEVVGVLMGFSLTEILDPLSSSKHPLMARFFLLIVFALFLTLDLHHPILRLLYESFESMPPGGYPFTHEATLGVLMAFSQLFHYALDFALLPLTLLLSLIAVFAVVSRFFSIFWIGFPLQLLIGFIALGASLYFFIPNLEHAFFQLWQIVKKSIVNY